MTTGLKERGKSTVDGNWSKEREKSTVDDNWSKEKRDKSTVDDNWSLEKENRPSMATGLKERGKSTVVGNWSRDAAMPWYRARVDFGYEESLFDNDSRSNCLLYFSSRTMQVIYARK